ncbi:hypothetical protein ACHHV8_05435 [Paenibacillus sp. TAB 01]|uniref:hypothetical protein n=1 Tax=Paenibacillus sp. TAB 01 TaxID=3368988 RepID=UPI0037539307
MKKNQLARKTMTGGVACALLLGSFVGGGFGTKAFAQTASVSAAAGYSPLVAQHLNSIVRDTAWLADKDAAVINEALLKGQTLAEASGLSASELTDKLTGLLKEDINHLYEDSDASSSELDALKAQGAAAIASAVSEKGFQPAAAAAVVDLNAVIQSQLSLVFSNASAFSSEDSSDIEQRLQSGQSLAQAVGLSQAELTSKLTAQLNQTIDNAVSQQHIAPSVVQKAKEDGARQLAEVIATGKTSASLTGNSATVSSSVYEAVYARLDSIVADATLLSDKDYIDVTDALQSGATLVQATGLSESGLYSSLKALMDSDIDRAAQGAVLEGDLNQVKNEAYDQIQTIITTPGFTATGKKAADDLKANVEAHLKLAASEAATLADKELYEVEDALKQGSSLAAATGLNSSELTQKLLASVNQYIDANSANVDADTVAKVKQDAAAYISQLVQTGTAE